MDKQLYRQDLLRQAVIEAARQYMAWQLKDERLPAFRGMPSLETVEALQTLRDALHAERQSRRS